MPIGQAIYDKRLEMIERATAFVFTVLTGRAWVGASLARWTKVTATSRRLLVGALVARVLAEALGDIKIGLSPSGDLNGSLWKLAWTHANDYAAKNELNILRSSRVMAKPNM